MSEIIEDIRESAREGMVLEIYRRHMYAMQAGNEPERARLFALIEELRWAFPDVDAAIGARYGEKAV